MGVTVHFEGSLAGEPAYHRVVEAVREFAASRDWPTTTIREAKARLQRVRGEEDWDYVGPTRGIAVQPHPNADPLRFEFDADLYVQEYCKTQFAPVEVHVEVVNLLRQLKSEFRKLIVDDEGEFWETSDKKKLEAHLSACFKALDEHLKSDPNLIGPVRAPSGRLLDLVSRESG